MMLVALGLLLARVMPQRAAVVERERKKAMLIIDRPFVSSRFVRTVCTTLRPHSARGTRVGTVSAVDAEGDAFVFLLQPQSSSLPFLVDKYGNVTVDGSLDFKVVTSYTLVVTVNETISRACPLTNTTTLTVSIVDVPDAPYFTVATAAVSIPEERVWPYNTSGVATFTALDYTPGNTSLVSLSVTGVAVTTAMGGYNYTRATTLPYFNVTTGAGARCSGGGACMLMVTTVSPRMDYDTGLRALAVTVTATGATGLKTSVVVVVTIVNYNERTLCGLLLLRLRVFCGLWLVFLACLRVCVFACLRVCVFVCLRVCVFACLRVCEFASLRVRAFVCL